MSLQFNSSEFFKKRFDLINCKPSLIAMEEVDNDRFDRDWEANSVLEYLDKQ